MSYTELEHGYQGLRSANRPMFYVGDISGVQPNLVGAVPSAIYRPTNRSELSDGCSNDDGLGGSDVEGEGKQVLVGICAMAKKSQSKPMKEILTRLEEFEYIKIIVFPEEVILKESVEDWPIVDCLISFHSKGFPLDKAISYANLRNPFNINNLPMQYDIQDRRKVYSILEGEGIEIPRYAVLDRDSADPKHHELVESEDHVEVNGVTFNKPFVEKPVSAEDHNIYIYYPTSAGGGSQRLFRKIGSRSSVYSPESRVRKTGSYIYEDFMPTDGTDVKVYTVGPDYAHAEARKSPALDGKVERDSEGKEIRYPVILSNAEKLISRKVCLAFKQTVCGFDLLRANGKSFVCDVNGFSFVKNSNKYYDDCAKILGNMILRELAPTLHIPWSVPFQLDDPPIVPTTFGKMMELRCVVAVIRHGDRTPKQKMKVEVRHPKFFEIFAKYDGYKHGHVKLKRPKQLQEILDTARSLLSEIQHRAASPELEEKQGKLEQLKNVLEMYGHFSGINRKVQMKYQPRGRPRGSSSDDGNNHNKLGEPSLVLILKWGGELTPAGRIQAEELGRIFRCMYPGGQGRHLSEEESEMLPNHGEYAGAQGLGLLRLHSTFRHDLKIYASDEGRVQMTAAAFAKGLLALEGELTPILVQMVKSANTNGLLDNDCDSSKYQNMVKTRLHELLQQDREFTREDQEQINPGNALSINAAMGYVKNPVKCCQHVHSLIKKLMDIVRIKKDDPKTKDAILYHGETWELMGRRWGKIEKDFCTKNKRFDISKIPDIYDCIKYDLQHNNHTLQFEHAEELYIYSKNLADIVIPQEYGLTVQEKLTIGQGICTPLLKKIRADLQRNIEESGDETVNRLNPRYSHGVSSPGRHVRTRLYFTSESHVHSLLTVLRYGGLHDVIKDEQWRRAMEYVSMVSELNYMSQIVVMLYEDPTKDPSSEERFHVELHFSPGVNCCVQKNLPPGPGFRPHSRNESSQNIADSNAPGQDNASQCSTRIEEEDVELSMLEVDVTSPPTQTDTPPSEERDVIDSTTTSRAIDMMDLNPNMMDQPFDSGFLQSSAPIPISARTVSGHEAARLGSQLAASQRQRREREACGITEPRARSYDHQRQEKSDKAADKLQYQSLDAVNKEATRPIPSIETPKHQTNVSTYLGKPVCLPHSISSPELPVPLFIKSINNAPLVTLHSVPLASPTNRSSDKPLIRVCEQQQTSYPQVNNTATAYRLSVNRQNSKIYGRRSQSELTLPDVGVTGECETRSPSKSSSIIKTTTTRLVQPLNNIHHSDPKIQNNIQSSFTRSKKNTDPSSSSKIQLEEMEKNFKVPEIAISKETNSQVPFSSNEEQNSQLLSPITYQLDQRKNEESNNKRSRSLSPCMSRCLCYNCNVSELIIRSVDLPESERWNFNIYFARSLSHKFSNCSCYALANLWQNESRCCCFCNERDEEAIEQNQYEKQQVEKNLTATGKMDIQKTRSCPDFLKGCPRRRCHSLRNNTNYHNLLSPVNSYPWQRSNSLDRLSSSTRIKHNNKPTIIHNLNNQFNREKLCRSESDLEGRRTLYDFNPRLHYSSKLDKNFQNHHSICSSTLGCLFTPAPIDVSRKRHSCSDSILDRARFSTLYPHRNDTLDHLSFNVSNNSSCNSCCHSLSNVDGQDQRSNNKSVCINDSSSPSCLDNMNYHCRDDNHNNEHVHRHSHHNPNCPHSSSRQSILQPQRSFSSPDTRPTIIQPDPTCTARRHRHSISGQMSYFKLLGYNVGKKLTGSANSLFSTAVISGSSSAPNLKDMVPPHASAVAAIDGFGGVPPIRPLETLHNALSLRQLDSFLEVMTGAPLFRTPASSPPKYPSPNGFGQETANRNVVAGREYRHSSDLEAVRYISPMPIQYKSANDLEASDIRSQVSPTSPNSAGWSSEPQSFLSSEPSSPAPTSTGECSMSISLISNDGATPPFTNGPNYSTTPCLDLDFNDFCMNIDQHGREGRGSISYTDYYSNEDGQIRRSTQYGAYASNFSKITCDDSIETVPDEDEDHTLTLRQNEDQKKQDVKLIFDQKENLDSIKSNNNAYKTIGRFRVESMEISDEDVRIKEAEKLLQSTTTQMEIKGETIQAESKKQMRHSSLSEMKKKHLSRSKSVSTPKTIKSEVECIYKLSKPSSMQMGSWRSISPNPPCMTQEGNGEGPILTLASSFKDNSHVTIGFEVQDSKE